MTYPRVYAPQPPRPKQDVSDAQTYGEITYLLDRGQVGGHPGVPWSIPVSTATRQIREGLADLREHDYLLLLGDPIAIGIMMVIAAQYLDTVNVLRWDRQESRYHSVTLRF